MTSAKLRQEFLDFFKKKGHSIMPSSSLLPNDPSVLFTTAGMQQFKPYYLGEKSPYGLNVVSCQKCFRTSDIDEVGDSTHATFLEMLGNFSFGGYFKEETIKWAWEFLTEICGLEKERLWITIFEGEKSVPEDKESEEIWLKLGIPKEKICRFGRKDNFWGPTGEEGPCGPTTEIHYDITQKPCEKGSSPAGGCLPNCECGRFVELWNLVFNEYFQDKEKKLTPLKQNGVDTGMGLERLAMAVQGKSSVFETDLFESLMGEIQGQDEKAKRIIADHIKGTVFLIAEDILPSNLERGYLLRRILRRAIRYGKLLNLPSNFLIPLAQKVTAIYQDVYPELKSKETEILIVIQQEEEKFEKTLEKGLKEFHSQVETSEPKIISGKTVFDLYQSYGFPLELTKELAKERGLEIDENSFKEEFEKHQQISRAGAEKKFGGVGKDATMQATKLHTATHLLHQALREILGNNVQQMGSDITSERLRFDFKHSRKMTEKELKDVEELVNQKIKEKLPVKKEEMSYQQAIRSGALAFFKEKYPEKVSVYSINDFSKEICAGPHVENTETLGKFKIIKEEAVGAGARRIRAVLE